MAVSLASRVGVFKEVPWWVLDVAIVAALCTTGCACSSGSINGDDNVNLACNGWELGQHCAFEKHDAAFRFGVQQCGLQVPSTPERGSQSSAQEVLP